MDPIIGGALISAGSSLVGSLLGSGTNNHAGRDQRQATSFANRSAVLDKVAAAKEAGISPLYALGAPVISASSAVGTPSSNELGSTLASMGQDIGRAVASKGDAVQRQLLKLQLEGAALDNDMKRAQINSINARNGQGGQLPPVMPIVGDSGVSPDGGLARVSALDDAGGRPAVVQDASGARTAVDLAVTPSQTIENEYGDLSEAIDGTLHYLTDKILRPANRGASKLLGEQPWYMDPWKYGAVSGAELRQEIKRLLVDLGLRRGKRYYDRLP